MTLGMVSFDGSSVFKLHITAIQRRKILSLKEATTSRKARCQNKAVQRWGIQSKVFISTTSPVLTCGRYLITDSASISGVQNMDWGWIGGFCQFLLHSMYPKVVSSEVGLDKRASFADFNIYVVEYLGETVDDVSAHQ